MFKTPLYDVLALLTCLDAIRKPIPLDFLEDLAHVLALVECATVEALIEGHSNCPDLRFFTVLIVKKSLWGHVGRRAYIIIQTRLLLTLNVTVTEVDNFGLPVMQ